MPRPGKTLTMAIGNTLEDEQSAKQCYVGDDGAVAVVLFSRLNRHGSIPR